MQIIPQTTRSGGNRMKKTRRESPYVRLIRIVKDWLVSVESPHQKLMWRYPKARLSEGWTLTDLNERVQAGRQLNYRVELRSEDEGLAVYYVKLPKDKPWELRD